MMNLREVQEMILMLYAGNIIDDEEFLVLYDVNTPKNPEYPFWLYPSFDLENYSDDECNTMFRFKKNGIYNFVEALHIPEVNECLNRQKIDSETNFGYYKK